MIYDALRISNRQIRGNSPQIAADQVANGDDGIAKLQQCSERLLRVVDSTTADAKFGQRMTHGTSLPQEQLTGRGFSRGRGLVNYLRRYMSVFLAIDPDDWIASNELAFAVRDQFPGEHAVSQTVSHTMGFSFAGS